MKQKEKKMADVSKKVVFTLVLVVIVLSLFSTFVVMNSVNQKITENLSVTKGTGHVYLNIINPEGSTQSSKGSVSVTITPHS